MVKSTLNKLFNSSASTKLEGTANVSVTSRRTSYASPSKSYPSPSKLDSPSSTLGFKLFAGQAIVDAMIQPGKNGRVRFQGSWWSARCEQDVTILPGEVVRVVGRQNITLIVEPMPLMMATPTDLN